MLESSGTGSGEFVAILLQSTVHVCMYYVVLAPDLESGAETVYIHACTVHVYTYDKPHPSKALRHSCHIHTSSDQFVIVGLGNIQHDVKHSAVGIIE